jgi:hypothetical protein
MKASLYLTLAILLAACGAAKMSTQVTDLVLSSGKQIYPDLTMDQLNHGQSIFEGQCNQCHPFKPFEKYNEESWNSIVPKMTEKANKKAGSTVISETDQADLLRYVVSMSASVNSETEEAEESAEIWMGVKKK